MRQVLANLLENAARYAPAGSPVTVRVRPVLRSGCANRGVRPRAGPDARTTRAASSIASCAGAAAQGTSGLGLGLYLCRAIVDQHGGRIGVDSVPGAGCTFWIELRTS